MKIRYVLTEKTINFEGAEYTSYGIAAYRNDEIAGEVSDVTTEIEKAEEIVKMFNTYALSPTHLAEAIENEIAE